MAHLYTSSCLSFLWNSTQWMKKGFYKDICIFQYHFVYVEVPHLVIYRSKRLLCSPVVHKDEHPIQRTKESNTKKERDGHLCTMTNVALLSGVHLKPLSSWPRQYTAMQCVVCLHWKYCSSTGSLNRQALLIRLPPFKSTASVVWAASEGEGAGTEPITDRHGHHNL